MQNWLWYYTLLHVAISLAGIGSGFVVLLSMLRSHASSGWTNLFLATTVLTSVTGFGFPFDHITPGIVIGVLSIIVLGLCIFARYSKKLVGRWGGVYVVSAVLAQYFNVFVLIAQGFQKIPTLHALAPTQAEPPFAIAQGLTLIAFVVLGVALFRTGPR